jgi:hypothetical protein
LPHQRAKLGYLNEYHDHPVWWRISLSIELDPAGVHLSSVYGWTSMAMAFQRTWHS